MKSNKQYVQEFYSIPRPNVRLTILHQLFLKENPHSSLSYSQFTRISKRLTSIKTIRTGGAEVDLEKLSDVIVSRAFRGVNLTNVIAIDEKPVVIKNYMIKSMRVLKKHKGDIYKSMLYGMKIRAFYIIAAVAVNGLISYGIFDSPVSKVEFQQFVTRVAMTNCQSKPLFLLYDNATFHNIEDECTEIISEYNTEITKTAPSSCFINPIEEYFGIFDTIFRQKYQKSIIDTGLMNPLSRKEIKTIIEKSLMESNVNLRNQFIRAGIF